MNKHQKIILEAISGQTFSNQEVGEALNSILNGDTHQERQRGLSLNDCLKPYEYAALLSDDEVLEHFEEGEGEILLNDMSEIRWRLLNDIKDGSRQMKLSLIRQ